MLQKIYWNNYDLIIFSPNVNGKGTRTITELTLKGNRF